MPLTPLEKARIDRAFVDIQTELPFQTMQQFVTAESAKDAVDMPGLHEYLVQRWSDIWTKRCTASLKMRGL